MDAGLKNKLKLWDGVHIQYLMELYEVNSSDLDFQLVSALPKPGIGKE
ncbi:MAG: hypothetical protein JSS91_10845 [Bacteroidetes bacterium]|nr:hypothetical protein [Bacteroidota bacterium]